MDNQNDTMTEEIAEVELTLKEYYKILVRMCKRCEEDPEDDFAIAAFTDAAWHLAHAECEDLFPEDLLCVNAAKTPKEGMTITAVKED